MTITEECAECILWDPEDECCELGIEAEDLPGQDRIIEVCEYHTGH